MDTQALGAAQSFTKQKVEPFTLFPQPTNKVKRVAILGHSYVSGGPAGDPPLTFGVPLAAALRAKYGDAGSGFIPWFDGKMGGIGHSSSFSGPNPLANSSSFTLWNDTTFHSHGFNGMSYTRAAGVGAGDTEFLIYTPNTADSFQRGVADTLAYATIFFTLHSANAGFLVRQTNESLSGASAVSNGAAITASTTGTVLTASAVTGIVPKAGAIVAGAGVTAATIITGNGSGNGGAGTYNINNSQSVSSEAMTVNGNVFAAVGVPQAITYQFNGSFNQTLEIIGCAGDVQIHGVATYNGNPGVTVTDFGLAGTTALQWASLDDASQRAMWQLANFDQVMVVLNMNDRTYVEPAMHGNHIATIVSRIQACARSKVLLVRETDSSDAASTFLSKYDQVLQNVASTMGCGYVDERACPGFANYAQANANGYMLGDGVHRSGAGNTLIGNFHAGKFTL